MIDTSQMGNGTVFEYEGNVWQIVWFQHHKPGKGGAMLRVKIRNVRTGSTIERSFRSGERFEEMSLSRKPMQFLYADNGKLTFMDPTSYEQLEVSTEKIGDSAKFLTENMEVQAMYLEEEFLGIELPTSVTLKVKSTVPGVKGDSVSNMVKPATLENDIEINVPLFIKEGEAIRVDTRTSEYVERA